MALTGTAVTIHVVLAGGALALGPLALWARKGSALHRSAGYVWVVLMLGTAVSSLFIRDFRLPNIAGYTPIHIMTVLAFVGIGAALYFVIAKRNIVAHRRAMRSTYFSLVVAGLFALAPGRTLGQFVLNQLFSWA